MRGLAVRAVVVAALLVSTAPAVDAGRVGATLDGRSIPIEQVDGLACHDFEYPIIRCFDSVASLEADVAIQTGTLGSRTALESEPSGYVVVYEHVAYGGANPKILTTDVAWLSDIGWNDKISSFKSFGATGEFYENSPIGGFIYSFGPNTRVPTLNGTYNDKFSSFYID